MFNLRLKTIVLVISVSAFDYLAQAQNLPSLGDKFQEQYPLSKSIVWGSNSSLKFDAPPTIPDPLLMSYLENITYRLASRANFKTIDCLLL